MMSAKIRLSMTAGFGVVGTNVWHRGGIESIERTGHHMS